MAGSSRTAATGGRSGCLLDDVHEAPPSAPPHIGLGAGAPDRLAQNTVASFRAAKGHRGGVASSPSAGPGLDDNDQRQITRHQRGALAAIDHTTDNWEDTTDTDAAAAKPLVWLIGGGYPGDTTCLIRLLDRRPPGVVVDGRAPAPPASYMATNGS